MGIEPPEVITDPKDAEAIIESMMKAWGDLRMARGQFEQMATGVRKYALWDLYPPDNPCGSEAALAKLLFHVNDLDEAKLTYQQRSKSAQAAAMVEAKTHTQEQAGKEMGVSQQSVSKALNTTKNFDSKKKVVLPNWIKGEETLARFRKLDAEAQAKVLAKEISVRAAAIAAGIVKVPTPFEVACKAVAKLNETEKAELKKLL